jgi:hypothetical protein
MGHWLWFGIAEQRNVPIRALLRFGNVKLKNVKVASGAVGAVLEGDLVGMKFVLKPIALPRGCIG